MSALPFCGRTPLMTTPYPTPLPLTPARGAMVIEFPCCCGGITSQFDGCAMLNGPKLWDTICGLGATSRDETGPAGSPGCSCEVCLISTPGGALKIAPFCLFSAAQRPDFAPSA